MREDENIDLGKEYSLEYAIEQSNFDTTGLIDSVIICEIPKNPAFTSLQYKNSSRFWPVQFREDK